MPSTSAKQAKFMRAVANSPKFAKKVGVPQRVGKDFEMADKKMKKFADGGAAKDRMEERMRKAEVKYKLALAKGKNEDVAKAKFERRNADIADDYAKKIGADRTSTKAAEQAAKATLKEARRTGGFNINRRDTFEKNNKPLDIKTDVAATLKGVNTTPLAAKKSEAPKVSAPKANKPTTATPGMTRAQLELRRTATRSQKAIREKRAENQADFRKRVQSGNIKPASASSTTASKGTRDNTAAGRRERMAKFFSSLNPYNQSDAKGTSGKPLILTGEAARKANKDTIGGMKKGGNVKKSDKAGRALVKKSADTMGRAMKFAKGGSVDGCAIRGKTRAPMKKGK